MSRAGSRRAAAGAAPGATPDSGDQDPNDADPSDPDASDPDALGPDAFEGLLREALLAALPGADPTDRTDTGGAAARPRDTDTDTTGDLDAELARFRALQRDYPTRGGKGLRGRLTLLAAAAFGADPHEALPAAVALELFQNWVLIHDDVEDDSETRRGGPALHRRVGAPVAINVGDALHVRMWRVLIETRAPWRDEALDVMLDTIDATAAGQHLDLAWIAAGRFDVGEDEILRMLTSKTAYYTVVAPLRLGALVAGVAPHARMEAAGLALGRAFQIRDDVLNLLPDASGAYGKEFAGDLYEGKRTLVLARAFAVLPAADAARLRTLLDRPREEKRETEIREALTLLERADAVAYAQGVADRDAALGQAALREVLADAADPAAARAVLDLVGSLAARDA